MAWAAVGLLAAAAGVAFGGNAANAQAPGIGVRIIDVSLNEVNSTTEAFDIALSLGATQEPYLIHRDVTAVLPVLDIGDPGTFNANLAYPGGYGLPGDEAHFVVAAYANVTIPAGRWQIAFGSDDGGALALSGVNLFDEFGENGNSQQILPGDGTLRYEAPRGHVWTGATIQLDQPVTAALSGVFFEQGGQDSFEIAIRDASSNSLSSVDPADGWTLLGDGALGWQVATDVVAGRRIGGQSLVGSESLLKRYLRNAVEGNPVEQSGLLADVYHGNFDSVADWDAVLADQPFPMAQGAIPNINWASHGRAIGGGGYPAAFAFEDPENREAYSVRAQGELLIPDNGPVRFTDGTDDYAFLAIDLDGDGVINSATEVLIDDDGAVGVTGSGSPIAIADFTNVTAGGEYRRLDYRMAEDAGFDAGVLYWDQNVGAPAFPSSLSTAANPQHLVPASAFRTTITPILSGDLVAGVDPGLPLVFDIDADALTADQVGLPVSPDPSRFRNVLDVDGASLIVELLAGALEPGDAFDLIDEANIDEIVGTPQFQFPYGEWDTSSFTVDGRITFLSGSIEPPNEMPETAWNRPGGGNWTEPTNWDAGVPNAVGDIALFNASAPTTSATITLDSPVQVEGIQSASPRSITIAGSGSLTFSPDAAGTTHIKMTSPGGGLTIGTPIQFPGETLSIEPTPATTTVRFDGGISSDSGDLVKNGAGNLVLAGNSDGWLGAILVNAGRIEGRHANAFGSAAAPTTIDGGRVDVKNATQEPFEVRDGSLRLAAAAGQITLRDGVVVAEQDVPLDILVDSPNGGEIRFGRDHTSPITLHGASPLEGENKVRFAGDNLEPFEFEVRQVSGAISGNGNPLTVQLVGGSRLQMQVSSALLAEQGIQTVEALKGSSWLTGSNTYSGQTIVRAGATLLATNEGALGAADGTADTGTIVEAGGRLTGTFGGIPPNELVILNGGVLAGEILGTAQVTEDSVIMNGRLQGELTGPGGLAFLGRQDGSINETRLHAANTYTGRSIIAMPDDGSVHVFHPHAFGDSPEDPLLAGGELHLHTELDRPIVADGGRVVVQMPTFTGDVVLQGGGITTDDDPVEVNTALQLNGGTSQLSGRNGRLYVNEPIQGHGDLIIGQRRPNDPAGADVTLNAPLEFDGDLIVTRPGVEFNVAPEMSGKIVLDRTPGGHGGGVDFNVDAEAAFHFRGGELRTADGVTVTSLTPTLTMQSGGINGNIAGVEQIVVEGAGEVLLQNIGNSDAELVVRNGLVRAQGQRGLGSTLGGVVVDSRRNAVLHIESNGDSTVVSENIRLNNAGGRNNLGGLILEVDRPDIDVRFDGILDAGEQGSVVQVVGDFGFIGRLIGGSFTLVGDGVLNLNTSTEHTGKTTIGTNDMGGQMSIRGEGALHSTSAIEIQRGSVLEIDKRGPRGERDLVADHIPISMHGGMVSTVVDGDLESNAVERLGPITAEQGASRIMFDDRSALSNPAVIALDSLSQKRGAVVILGVDSGDRRLGEAADFNPNVSRRVVVGQSPQLAHGIIGGWAFVQNSDDIDFATYDLEGDRGVVALPRDGRPEQINAATQDDHVLVHTAPSPLTSDTSIASLMVIEGVNGGTEIDLGESQLIVETGGILGAAPGFNLTGGSVTAGAESGGELVVYTSAGNSTIESSITDGPSGTVSFSKAGVGTLHLRGENTYSGDTFLNEGRIDFYEKSAFPKSTNLFVTRGDIIAQGNETGNVSSVTVYGGNVTGIAADEYTLYSGSVDIIEPSASVVKLGLTNGRAVIADGFDGVVEIREGSLEITNTDSGNGSIVVHKDAALIFASYFENSRAFGLNIELNGGEVSALGGGELRPQRIAKRIRVSADSEIAGPSTVSRHLVLEQGLHIDEGATLAFTGAGTLHVDDAFTIEGDATLDIQAGVVDIPARLESTIETSTLHLRGPSDEVARNEAQLILAGDNRQYAGDLVIEQLTVRVANQNALGGGTTTLLTDASLILEVNNVRGNIVLDGGQLVTHSDSQFIGTITNASELSPGASPGRLGVSGSFLQDDGGRLVMEIASPLLVGPLYDRQSDSIEATQTIRADGELVVRLLHGYSPSEGESFDLFDFSSLEGEFDRIELPALDASLLWDTSRLYTAGELSVVREGHVRGDYNSDGKVDQADLDLVLLNWGAPTQTPPSGWTSDLPSGLVDQNELDGVLLHWGTGTGPGSVGNGGAVPEPATLPVLVVLFVGMLAAKRCSRAPRRATRSIGRAQDWI